MDAENKTTGEVKSEVINEPKTVIVGGNAALGKATTDDGSIGRAANMESPQPILEEISEFQIGTDVVSSNVLSMVPTEQDPFTVCSLVKVESVNLDTKNGVKKVLQFTFEKKVDTTIRRYVHTEWAVEDYKTQEELVTKREGLKSRIKHIYEAYMEYPIDTTKQFGYGTKNWSEFFDQIASKFNTDGENKTPIYVGVPVWLKLSINLKYPKGGFQIPLSPNFIERCRKGVEKPTSLALNPKYETIKQELATVGVGGANTSSSNASGTMSNQAAFPNFPGMS